MNYLRVLTTSAIGVTAAIFQTHLAMATSITLPDGSKCEGEVNRGVLNGQATYLYWHI
jgi:hypothetical protein